MNSSSFTRYAFNIRGHLMNVQIRVATPNDVEALRALMKELVAYMDEDFVEKRFEWGIQRRLYDPLQRHGLLIAEKVLINVKKGRAKTVEELYKKLKFQEKYSVMERVFNND